MDLELPELPESKEAQHERMNTQVAITVTLLVTFLALCRLFDNSLVLQMQETQADKIDHWNWYQSLSVREDINQAKLTDLRADRETRKDGTASRGDDLKMLDYQRFASKLAEKREKIKRQADEEEKRYKALDAHHQHFDATEGFLSIAVSLLALTSLLQKRWMFLVALVPTIAGVVEAALAFLA